MRAEWKTVLLASFFFSTFLFGAGGRMVSKEPLERSEVLDPEGDVEVSWKYLAETEEVEFRVSGRTQGFVGFGLSRTGGMADADIVLGGVHPNGTTYFSDEHGVGNRAPVRDEEQNWFLTAASQNSTHTVLNMRRALDTCDEQDVTIDNGTTKFIWALGRSDRVTYHGSRRGAYDVHILDPPMPPLDTDRFESWEMVAEVRMPPNPSSYWCTVHRSPPTISKRHVVGFRPVFGNAAALHYTHHIIVHSCQPPQGQAVEDVFEKYVGTEGNYCFNSSAPYPPSQLCRPYTFVWAVGGKSVMYPDHVGFPFAEHAHPDYFLLDIHFDNRDRVSGLQLRTGLEFFYTDTLRTHDAGTITVGHEVRPELLIPPNSTDFLVVGHCAPACTRHFPPTGIHVFNVLLHSHLAGRKLKLRHFRGKEELPWPAVDNSYDFNYQQDRPLVQEVTVLPGDHLITECKYDSVWKKGSVIGGLGTEEEMCNAFVWYYPRMPVHRSVYRCVSHIPRPRLLSFFGIQGMDRYGTNITGPARMAGRSLTQVLDTLVPWTPALRKSVQEELQFGDQLNICALGFDKHMEDMELTSYPFVSEPYQPSRRC